MQKRCGVCMMVFFVPTRPALHVVHFTLIGPVVVSTLANKLVPAVSPSFKSKKWNACVFVRNVVGTLKVFCWRSRLR